jgi:hypothetical protein
MDIPLIADWVTEGHKIYSGQGNRFPENGYALVKKIN